MDASTRGNAKKRAATRAKTVVRYLPSVSKQTADMLLAQKHSVDLIALYFFYLYTATWQGTNRPKATTAFCAKGLHITQQRIRAAKKRLIELGLAEDYIDRDPRTRTVKGWYIRVKFIRSGKRHTLNFSEGGIGGPVADRQTNALSANNGNASSAYNTNAITPNPLPGGEEDSLIDKKATASKLLQCLRQDPNRTLTRGEMRAVANAHGELSERALEQLQWFYLATLDKDSEPEDQRLLRTRKLKLTTLAMDLPQQVELARQWAAEHPIPRPPPPAPHDWRKVLESLYPNVAHFSLFEQLPSEIQAEIRRMSVG